MVHGPPTRRQMFLMLGIFLFILNSRQAGVQFLAHLQSRGQDSLPEFLETSINDLLIRDLIKEDPLESLAPGVTVYSRFILGKKQFWPLCKASVALIGGGGPTTSIKITWKALLKMQVPTSHPGPTESGSLRVQLKNLHYLKQASQAILLTS